MEISLGVAFRGFNAPKFVLYLCLLLFLVLFALRLDGKILISYIFVFLPLWTCHFLVFLGAIIGIISFIIHPPSRNDIIVRNDFVAMLLTTMEHLFLLAFDSLVFYKLEYDNVPVLVAHLHWTVVFTPLFALSIVSLGVAVWALKHEKSLEFEFLYAINIIEFFFISFKLDDQVDWSWAVVFIPLWVVLSLSAVGVLYALVLSIVLARSRHLMPSHRRQHLYSAVLHTFLVLPALTSLVLLTGKLDALQWSEKDSASKMSFTAVLFPLWISLLLMMAMAFGNGGGNIWWFAMRRPFCTFLLDSFPCLGQYANVSYKIGANRSPTSSSSSSNSDEAERPLRPVMPMTSIECPD